MKVLIWGEHFLPIIGGAEIFLSQFMPALTSRDIDFEVITSRTSPKLSEEDNWQGIPIHRLDIHRALNGDVAAFLEARRRVFQLYEMIRPDLIHIHSTGPSLFLEMQTHRIWNIPRFLTIHAFFSYPPKMDGYLRPYLSKVNFLSGVSHRILQMAVPLFSGPPPPGQVIYNGVLPPNVSRPLPQGRNVILSLGRLSPEKGVDLCIRAFHRLCESRNGVEVWVAGEGPERSALEDMAKSLGIGDRIVFLGRISPEYVYSIIAEVRFLVIPSRIDEGLPLTALQAAHMGKPVIGARRGGLPEIVRDGETGLLFEPEDWQGLAAAMERLLDDPDLCRTLGEKARELAKTQFDFTAMVDAYERIYRQLAPGK